PKPGRKKPDAFLRKAGRGKGGRGPSFSCAQGSAEAAGSMLPKKKRPSSDRRNQLLAGTGFSSTAQDKHLFFRQRFGQVGDQVLGAFQTDREAEKSVGDAPALPFLPGHRRMGHREIGRAHV